MLIHSLPVARGCLTIAVVGKELAVFMVRCPDTAVPEITYIVDILLGRFLGLDYRLEFDGSVNDILIEADGNTLAVDAGSFSLLESEPAAFARPPAPKMWETTSAAWCGNAVERDLPVIFGEPEWAQTGNGLRLAIDLFGSSFFALSRFEELHTDDVDEFDRFGVRSAHAFQHDYLLRPVVDEMVEVLWSAIVHLWPRTERRERSFSVHPTHDIDDPLLAWELKSLKRLLRRLGGDIVRRKDPALAWRTAKAFARKTLRRPLTDRGDPYDVFDWLMSTSEAAGCISEFYFMTHLEPDHPQGGRYDVNTTPFATLVRKVHDGGHIVGIHPTGDSSVSGDLLGRQLDRIRGVLSEAGASEPSVGGRMHYLLWRQAITPAAMEANGMAFDSTLGHADHVGFRCGTCHSFPLWDPSNRRASATIERPLLIMETSLLAPECMDLSEAEAAAMVRLVKRRTRAVNGEFVFLWHNASFVTPMDHRLYELCLTE